LNGDWLERAGLRGELREHEPMARHVSWRAGGPVRLAYFPADLEDLRLFLSRLRRDEKLLFVGLGSNLLVRDAGFDGTVVFTHGALKALRLEGDGLIYAEAGVAAPKLARFAANQHLGGAEFLAGIPGTVGGALAMNAGCYGGETWRVVERVLTVDRAGQLHERAPGDFAIGYRHVGLKGTTDEWFAAAWLRLPAGQGAASRDRIRELLEKRIASQPLQLPNAGSVFRNPDGDHAARLIEAAGLKGLASGDARVSEQHANFIVNPQGSASAKDIENLIDEVQRRVRAHFGVELVREVRIVGERAGSQESGVRSQESGQAGDNAAAQAAPHSLPLAPDAFGRVAVLLGGMSAEREISLLSGNAVLAALKASGVDAHAFDPAERSPCRLAEDGFERVFIALHGRGGEDGTVQGVFETLGLPYTGSGVMASALAMDKWRTKMVWAAAGLPTPPWRMLRADDDWDAVAAELGLPIFVKPAREGSSVGATKVAAADRLAEAYALAARHDPLVLAERFVAGQELTCAFVGEQALPLVRIVAPDGNYDYQNKYFSDQTRYFCPSGLPEQIERHIQELVMRAAALLGCRGWGRADLILTDDGTPFLLEMNTSPGMTGHSLVPMAARAAGIGFEDLVLRILREARCDE
jgi:D-alanine-D-alanine ligase